MAADDNRQNTAGPNVRSTSLDQTTVDTATSPMATLVGRIINGRYAVKSELKRGGMGVVYLAEDQQLHSRKVVVKVLLDSAYQSEYVVQKFRQEVEALSRIDHPGVVGVIDSGELPNGRPFLVMQFVDGVTLRSLMTSEGMNLERAAEIAKQVGRALAAAHSRGIFHRDLKPDNIMLQALGHGEEQVKIIDFGIAKVKSSVVAPSTSLNLSPGTVAYMAPEQLSGRPITSATDVYALGTIVYEMLTGRKPFNPETGYELLQMQQTGVRIMPADLRPSVSEETQAAILKALAFNPSDRFSSPREFGDALAKSLSESPPPTRAAPPVTNLPPTAMPPTVMPPVSGTHPSEVTPLAKGRAQGAAPTIQVPFHPAAPPNSSQQPAGFAPAGINPSAAQLGFSNQNKRGGSKSKVGLVIGLGVILILIVAGVGVGGFLLWRGTKSEDSAKTPPPVPGNERNLNYGLTVQKMRDGKPYQEEFESTGQEIFENGWKFRMNIDSSQAGYLYLLNEGPADGDMTTYNLLFPAPSSNSGSPYLSANQKVETSWMVFDQNQGTEKFWMVWSAEAVPELEAVKGVVNPQDKGEISEPGQRRAIKQFLEKQQSAEAVAQKDKNKKKSSVKSNGNILVHHLELEHH